MYVRRTYLNNLQMCYDQKHIMKKKDEITLKKTCVN